METHKAGKLCLTIANLAYLGLIVASQVFLFFPCKSGFPLTNLPDVRFWYGFWSALPPLFFWMYLGVVEKQPRRYAYMLKVIQVLASIPAILVFRDLGSNSYYSSSYPYRELTYYNDGRMTFYACMATLVVGNALYVLFSRPQRGLIQASKSE